MMVKSHATTTTLRMQPVWVVFLLLVFVHWGFAPAAALSLQESASHQSVATGKSDPQLSELKQAAMKAQQKAESDPSEANLFLYASSLMKLDYPSAEKIYRFGISKYPDSVRLHAGLASALWALGRPDEGAEELCRAAEIAPTDPHPLEFLVAT